MPESGLEYRLIFPEGAVVAATEVAVTPIAEYEGFPFSGGLVGGVHLEPSGLTFLKPVTIEIYLGTRQINDLKGILDAGMAVHGFSYVEDGEELAATRVEVAADLTVIRIETLGFSGHGAGVGTPEDLANLGPPSDAMRAAQQELERLIADDTYQWLNDPNHDPNYNGPYDNPTLRADISQVLQDLFDNEILPLVGDAVSDSSKFDDALNASLEWQGVATWFKFLSDAWGVPTDEFASHGLALKSGLTQALVRALSDADAACRASGDLADLAHVIDLDQAAAETGLRDSQLDTILTPQALCLRLRIKVSDSPEELVEWTSANVTVRAETQSGPISPSDMVALVAEATFSPRDPALLSVQPETTSPAFGTGLFSTEMTAGASGGESVETSLDIALTIHGRTVATEVLDFVIEPFAITCSGDPVTLVNVDDSVEQILITFDGLGNCNVISGYSDQEMKSADFPDAVVLLDSDPGEPGWDDQGPGDSWSRQRFGDDAAPGDYTVSVTHGDPEVTYTMRFTVDISVSGTTTTMTVQDINFTIPAETP